MSSQRILVMGDNHGDTTSLEGVVEETEGESFDFIIHVGDITNAYRDGIEEGVNQLQAVEPYFETLAQRGELLYIYGNRDKATGLPGETTEHVTDYHQLSVGTRVPQENGVMISGQRFTQDPEDVGPDDILVKHGLVRPLIDHFEGRAYFSGHVHTGRYKSRILNSAFLYRDSTHGAEPIVGGYFVVEVTDEPPFTIDFRNLERLKRIICPKHHERGVLFSADYYECQFCYSEPQLEREMAESAFYGLTHDRNTNTVEDEDLIDYAMNLFESPPNGFQTAFRGYLQNIKEDPKSPLIREEGNLTTYR